MNHLTLIAGRLTLTIALALASYTCQADWRDWLKQLTTDENTSQAVTALADSEVADGLRAALSEGVRTAVGQLGKKDGFLANASVQIPVPKHLQGIEQGLRKIGQGHYADSFIASLNRAAEGAVPHAADVFAGAISRMTLDDARAVLQGAPDAATQYLRRSSHDELRGRFAPLVDSAMADVGVTNAYQSLLKNAGPLAALINTDQLNLTNYVTEGALDGLYSVIAAEEKRIRENPAARTTTLLKKVFGG